MVRLAKPNFERSYPSKNSSLKALRWFWSNFWSTGNQKQRGCGLLSKPTWKRSPNKAKPNVAEEDIACENALSFDALNEPIDRESVVRNGRDFCRKFHPKYEGRTFSEQTNEIQVSFVVTCQPPLWPLCSPNIINGGES